MITAAGARIVDKCPCCGQKYIFPEVTVSLDQNAVSFGGETVFVTPTQAEIAFVLAGKMPQTARREFLIDRVWGANSQPDASNVLDTQVCGLRKLIRPLRLAIETTRHVGYRMVPMAAVAALSSNRSAA